MNNEVKLNDWSRIFLGDVPPEFIIEVILRMAFIYVILVVSLRLMGRRMEAMLSRGEMVSLVTLGASVGVAIHTPERGILPSAMVIVIILGMQTLQAYLTSRSSRAERILLDQIATVVIDGRLRVHEMKKSRITRERLFGALRLEGIKNLATIQRVYFEAKGVFSIVTFEDEKQRPGLCLIPDTDEDYRSEMLYDETALACRSCGNVTKEIKNTQDCDNCGAHQWEKAITGNE